MSQETSSPTVAAPPNRRRALLAALAGVFVLAGVAYGGYWFVHARHLESTDNAYVQGNVVQITPQIGGTVLAIQAEDTDFVKAGQSLVRLDPADAQLALDQAEAQLAQTVREVRTLFVNNATFGAQIALREADVARAQADVAKAQDDVDRRAPLVRTGAVGQEEFDHSATALKAAQSALAAARSAAVAAREQLASNRSLTDGTSVEQHPSVQRAAAQVREAFLALKRADLPAPVDGYVARRSVQVGQRVQAGAPLMSVVPLDQVWVDANFKEGQLRRMRIGQPVTLHADLYGESVDYHGRIAGLGAGTGAAFSLLPAQNATGNWIKVVQRLPVRVALDAAELRAHPLRVGLSMQAEVDVREQGGKSLADAPRAATVASTQVFDALDAQAESEVRRIVAEHLGAAAARPAPAARAAAVAPQTLAVVHAAAQAGEPAPVRAH